MTLVSVVIPAYNAERFLADAIRSVEAQDHEPVETIVVDDGSTDRTVEVARSLGVRCLRQANRGHAAARNAGLGLARGELVAFLDADDVWEPHKLSRQVAHLAANPEVGYVVCRVRRTRLPGASRPPGAPADWFQESQPGTVHIAALIRRSVLDRVGHFDSSYRHSSDTEWCLRAAEAGVKWHVLPDVDARYRMHDRNQSYDVPGLKRDLFSALRASLDRRRAADPHGGTS
jgi:glycosyltransferase involved in cell wall biosynthesis